MNIKVRNANTGERFSSEDCPSAVKSEILRSLKNNRRRVGCVYSGGQRFEWIRGCEPGEDSMEIELTCQGVVVTTATVPLSQWQAFAAAAASQGETAEELLVVKIAQCIVEAERAFDVEAFTETAFERLVANVFGGRLAA